MAEHYKTKIVVNPRSANGRTGKNWPQLREEIQKYLPEFDHEFTTGPFDAARIARESLKQGYEMIVAMGGDGTISETVNGFFENGAPIREGAVLGALPMGTGCDFVKTLGVPKPIQEAAPILAGRISTPCDVGHLTYTTHDGETAEQYFINIADFGMGGEIVNRVNTSSKALKGFLSFLIGTLRAAAAYKDKHVRLHIDGEDIGERHIRNVIIANGRYFGAGMHIAPEALIDDGLFDVLIMHKLSIVEGIRILPKLYKGTVMDAGDAVEFFRAKEVSADSEETVLLDVDGEQPGRLPATLSILPAAIRVKALPQE